MIRAGSLNRRLTYEVPDPSAPRGALNQRPNAWATAGVFWGSVRTPNGREALNAQQMKSQLTDVVTIRFQAGINVSPLGRFVYSTPVYTTVPRILNITAVVNLDAMNRELTCYCTEVAAPPPS